MQDSQRPVSIMRFPVRYEYQRAVIRFAEPVTPESILNLCDEIDHAIVHYYYKRVTVEIDSPGGEIKALLYYLDKLRQWRTKGIRIETLALTDSCSAASLMLSLGDVGHRRAMPNACLLYHNARIFGAREALTSDRLTELNRELARTDSRLLVELLRHLYGGLGEEYFKFLREYKCVLPYREEDMTPDSLKFLTDARIKRMLAASEEEGKREALVRAISAVLEKMRRKNEDFSGVDDVGQIRARAAAADPGESVPLVLAWLCSRFDHYRAFFARDRHVRPAKALAENLIDAIEE